MDRESHYVWGKRYLLKVVEEEAPPAVALEHSTLVLRVRPGTDEAKRQAVVEQWPRPGAGSAAAADYQVGSAHGCAGGPLLCQRMKTKWGSCNPTTGYIRLNTDLAKKPRECLEYVLVHEMAHLLEPTHNARFASLMDRFMPNWQFYRKVLNDLPVRHEQWQY